MPRHDRPSGHLDSRASHAGTIPTDVELTYLRAGAEPLWERPHRDGVDITSQPELWSPYQRDRRESFAQRIAQYRACGLI